MINNQYIISIITPSFNQEKFIEDTIKSVIYQEGNFYIDYIIIDGNSTDNSSQIIKDYYSLLNNTCKKTHIQGLTFYKNEEKSDNKIKCLGVSYRFLIEPDEGQTNALNKGFKMAVGDIFAFINSDDTYYPNTLNHISRFNWAKTDFVYGEGMWMSRNGKDLLLYPTYKPTKNSLFYRCVICQPSVFMKKEVYCILGEFSMQFKLVFDYEYWLRAIFNNKKFSYIKIPLSKVRMYNENKSLSGKNVVIQENEVLRKKYFGDNCNSKNKFLDKYYYYFINKPTNRKEKQLYSLLKMFN